jgi:LacI family transcriptional regulator
MGYRPNTSARAARTGKFGAIGLLMSTDGRHSVLGEIIGGIQQAMNEADLALRFCAMPDEEIDDEHIAKLTQELCVDGVLVNYTHEFPPQLMDLLEQCRIPAIWVNTRQDQDCVYADEHAIGVMGAEDLLSYGHRKIGYFTDIIDPHGHYSVIDAHAGYCDAMRQAGLTPNVLEYDDSGATCKQRLERIMAWLQETQPTAVFTRADSFDVYVRNVAAALGLDIPDDLSLLTTIQEGHGALFGPDVIYRPTSKVGHVAVEMLAEKIAIPRTVHDARPVAPYRGSRLDRSIRPYPHGS